MPRAVDNDSEEGIELEEGNEPVVEAEYEQVAAYVLPVEEGRDLLAEEASDLRMEVAFALRVAFLIPQRAVELPLVPCSTPSLLMKHPRVGEVAGPHPPLLVVKPPRVVHLRLAGEVVVPHCRLMLL